jgi:hypothetical protein
VTLLLGDVVRLRRTHPCGGDRWQVVRLGADIGIDCQTCGRHVLIDRVVLEGRITDFIVRGETPLDAAAEIEPGG